MPIQKIKLIAPTPYQHTLCELFSKECYKTNADMYARRGQHDRAKIMADIYLGKMGEFAVFNFTQSLKKKITPPDIMIYDVKLKSFDADLVSNGNNIHVKTQVIVNGVEPYWTFQPKDPITSNPKETDFVSLVLADTSSNLFFGYFISASELLKFYENARYGDNNRKYVFENNLLGTNGT